MLEQDLSGQPARDLFRLAFCSGSSHTALALRRTDRLRIVTGGRNARLHPESRRFRGRHTPLHCRHHSSPQHAACRASSPRSRPARHICSCCCSTRPEAQPRLLRSRRPLRPWGLVLVMNHFCSPSHTGGSLPRRADTVGSSSPHPMRMLMLSTLCGHARTPPGHVPF